MVRGEEMNEDITRIETELEKARGELAAARVLERYYAHQRAVFQLDLLENRDADIMFESFSLAELAQDVAQKFALAAEQKNISLNTEIPPDAPFVSGDIGMIERALDNLIENALKFTPSGGSVNLILIPASNAIVTTVKDTGPGIPEKDLPNIFERFYRVERNETNAPEGTGLGLAITRRILQLHGSEIVAQSPPDSGVSFSFPLPVATS